MKQYNRIMLGEHGMYIADCLDNNYIGADFLKDYDLSESPYNDEVQWRQKLVEKYLQVNSDKSSGTARNSIGFLWTICFGLKKMAPPTRCKRGIAFRTKEILNFQPQNIRQWN